MPRRLLVKGLPKYVLIEVDITTTVEFELWHETMTESLVVATYFPHLIKDRIAYEIVRAFTNSNAFRTSQRIACDEETVLSAKRILEGFKFVRF